MKLRTAFLPLVFSILGCGGDGGDAELRLSAGPALEVRPGAEVTLVAAVSPDPDAVQWRQIGGPAVTLTEQGRDGTFVAPTVAQSTLLSFEASATWDGATRSDTTAVLVVAGAAPAVEAGPAQQVSSGDTVVLAGVAMDSDGDIAITSWTQLSGPMVSLSSAEDLEATFVAPTLAVDRDIVLQLTAEDALGARTSDTVTISVVATNAAPTVSAGSDQIVAEGDVVSLAGVATDADGNLASVRWQQVAGPVVELDDATALDPTFAAPNVTVETELTFRLSAVDDLGASADDFISILVEPGRIPPVADAGPALQAFSGDVVTLTGVATDEDGTIVLHGWSQIGGPAVSLDGEDTPTATFTAPAVASATDLVFQYQVGDDDGLIDVDFVTVAIRPPAGTNSLPVVDAGADIRAGSASVTVLSGTASDSDGTVTSIEWIQIAGPTVALDDATSLTPRFTAPSVTCVDRLLFELRATDDQGGVGTDRVAVSVTGVGQAIVEQPYFADLEIDDGGLTTDGVWEHGPPSTGPTGADTGVNVWGTVLGGAVPNNTDASLCLPGIRLGGGRRGVLSFRLRSIVQNNDGLTVQMLHPEQGWISLDSVPSPSATAVGLATYPNLGLNADYVPVFVELPEGIADPVFLRFRFVSDGSFQSNGAYVDTIAVGLEADDPDEDGLPGIRDEYVTYGTDPYRFDTDGDGVGDGDEVAAGTDPLVPTDYPDAATVGVGDLLDFDNNGDGLLAEGGWQHGAPGAGPGAAYSGGQVWAVNLNGGYTNDARAFLYLPPIDLAGATDPLFTFRLWTSASNNDGLVVEVRGDDGTWNSRGPVLTPFDGTSVNGAAWTNQGYRDEYVLAAIDLSDLAGERALVRFAFRSDGGFTGLGPYIDDVVVVSASADADNDGIPGVLAEANGGSDPLVADTDGDGALDGAEAAAGTDFLNPADYPGARVWTVPTSVEFESDDGGLVSQRDIWQFGTPANGPLQGHTGGSVWGLRLAGNYANNDRAFLYLPAIDVSTASDPTLYFRIDARCANNDGVTIERFAGGTWASLVPEFPAYDGRDALGFAAWTSQEPYALAAVSLAPFAGQTVRLRFSFRANGSFAAPGAFIDDIRIDEEATDTDADGLPGIIDEFMLFGTDPELFDTDADGVGDGDEITAGTDPLDPSSR